MREEVETNIMENKTVTMGKSLTFILSEPMDIIIQIRFVLWTGFQAHSEGGNDGKEINLKELW